MFYLHSADPLFFGTSSIMNNSSIASQIIEFICSNGLVVGAIIAVVVAGVTYYYKLKSHKNLELVKLVSEESSDYKIEINNDGTMSTMDTSNMSETRSVLREMNSNDSILRSLIDTRGEITEEQRLLIEEAARLKEKAIRLEKENLELKRENVRLRMENTELKDEMEKKLKEFIEEVRIVIVKQSEMIKELKEEIKELRKRDIEREKEVKELKEENKIMKEENKIMKKKVGQLEDKVQEMWERLSNRSDSSRKSAKLKESSSSKSSKKTVNSEIIEVSPTTFNMLDSPKLEKEKEIEQKEEQSSFLSSKVISKITNYFKK